MTFFFTLQLIVTLDSIRNSCDVYSIFVFYICLHYFVWVWRIFWTAFTKIWEEQVFLGYSHLPFPDFSQTVLCPTGLRNNQTSLTRFRYRLWCECDGDNNSEDWRAQLSTWRTTLNIGLQKVHWSCVTRIIWPLYGI